MGSSAPGGGGGWGGGRALSILRGGLGGGGGRRGGGARGGGGGFSPAPFPRAARRTRRASSPAPGSPRACRWSSGDQSFQVVHGRGVIAQGDVATRPRQRDLRSAVAVSAGAERDRVEQLHAVVGGPPLREVGAAQPTPVALAVSAAQPADHAPVGVVAQVGERR